MARILLLIIIVFFIYLLYRGFMKSKASKDAPPQAPRGSAEDMIVCTRCGVNMPRSAAREEGGRLVCDNNPQCH